MEEIKAISFDMEGTLIPLDYSNLIWETDIPRLYGEKTGQSFNEAKNFVISEYDSIGPNTPEWYDIDYWFKRLSLENDWAKLLKERKSACKPFSEVRGVLKRLHNHYRLVVSSNTIRDFLEVQLQCLPNVFEAVFSAPSDFGRVKDDTFFHIVRDALDVDYRNIVHVGDNPNYDYKIPNKLGIKAYLIDRKGNTKEANIVSDLEDFEALLNKK
jgi:putative hydrolase of the HAD superfamily